MHQRINGTLSISSTKKGDGNDVPTADVSTNNLCLNAHSPVTIRLDRPDISTNPHPDIFRLRAALARGPGIKPPTNFLEISIWPG